MGLLSFLQGLLEPKKTSVVVTTIEPQNSIQYTEEKDEQLKPLPADDRKTIFLDDVRYYIAWDGEIPESTFSIERTSKITMKPTHILIRDEIIHLAEISNNKYQVYSQDQISSQISSKGWGKNYFWDWLRKVHQFPWNFQDQYTEKESYENDYAEIWSGELPATTFSRIEKSTNQRIRTTVIPQKLLKGKITDTIYFEFIDDETTIRISEINIASMLTTEGQKKMKFDEWVQKLTS